MKFNFIGKCFAIMGVLFLYTLIGTSNLYAQGGILTPVPASDIQVEIDDPFVVRERTVQLDVAQIVDTDQDAAADIDADPDTTATDLILNLFPDVILTVNQTAQQRNASGSVTWVGQVVDDEESSVILIIDGDEMVGNIATDGGRYQIRNAGEAVYSVAEIDQSEFPPGAEPLEPAINEPGDASGNDIFDDSSSDDGSIIDVMVLYTENAKNAAFIDGVAMDDLIDLAIFETNLAYERSGVIHRLNLVHQTQVDYVESNRSYDQHLGLLSGKSDGEIDDIHSLRDQYKADIVSLIVDDKTYCGIAWVMGTPSHHFESSAFNIVNHRCATGKYSFGHEIGHNLGLMHDRNNSGRPPAHPYGYGYQAPDNSFRTIMAYKCGSVDDKCPRIQRFSNPHVFFNNQSTGVNPEVSPNNSAFAALAMNNVRKIAANWRASGNGTCSGITQIPGSECEALAELYEQTGGSNWTNNTNWFRNNQPCSWFGIRCDGGHVVDVRLHQNNLVGTIPSELESLSELRVLYLHDNELTGEIPPELGDLEYLQILALAENSLTGNIPVELGNLSNLIHLYLSENQLSGPIPVQLGNLTELVRLYLRNNQLTGSIPTSLGNLSKLEILYLYTNQLTGEIPAELGQLSNLVQLQLQTNQLTGIIPTELGNLTNLTYFYAGENQLSGPIPAQLGNLTQLIGLILSENQLSGSIPAQLGNLKELNILYLNHNQLTGSIPSSLGNLSKLEILYLHDNQLSGVIPPELGNLTEVTHFYLRQNALSGSIPATLGNLENVLHLYLNDNQLTGSIPTSLGNLDNALTLAVSYNQLTGIIPAELSRLSKLKHLALNDNLLSGTIPPALGNLTELTQLGLRNNQLTGTIPPELGNLSKLELLHLYDNQLTGPIPTTFGNLSSLVQLQAQRNQLTGIIPVELANLSNLTQLTLSSNQLNGTIPVVLSNLSNLNNLGLANNQLKGSIPSELSKLSNLVQLYLSTNQLTGTIPEGLGSLSKLEILFLNENQLSGVIPTEFGNLSALTQLRLHTNQLTGVIPPSLGNLSNLEILYLYDNQLSGVIPPELGNLTEVTHFYLRQNVLSGSIPATLGNLENVLHFYLNDNQLTGSIPASLGNLENVLTLAVSYNQLTGPIPAELGGLSQVETLALNNNQLSGSVPSELGNLSSLKRFYLRTNQLEGPLPDNLASLRQLEEFHFNDTQLCEPDTLTAWLDWLRSIPTNDIRGTMSCSIGDPPIPDPTPLPPTPTPSPTPPPGDVGCDGTAGSVDALYILQYDIGARTGSDQCPEARQDRTLYLPACDISGDGVCGSVDALFILRCDIGMTNPFCPAGTTFENETNVRNEGVKNEGAIAQQLSAILRLEHPAQVNAGETFTVNVEVESEAEMGAVTASVGYDPEQFEFVRCPELKDDRFFSGGCNLGSKDGEDNRIIFNAVMPEGVSGSLTLAEITFKQIGTAVNTDRFNVKQHTFTGPDGGLFDVAIEIVDSEQDSNIEQNNNLVYLPVIVR